MAAPGVPDLPTTPDAIAASGSFGFFWSRDEGGRSVNEAGGLCGGPLGAALILGVASHALQNTDWESLIPLVRNAIF